MLRFSKGLFAAVGALMLLAAPTMVNAQEDCHRELWMLHIATETLTNWQIYH